MKQLPIGHVKRRHKYQRKKEKKNKNNTDNDWRNICGYNLAAVHSLCLPQLIKRKGREIENS